MTLRSEDFVSARSDYQLIHRGAYDDYREEKEGSIKKDPKTFFRYVDLNKKMDKKTFFKGNFLLILLTELRTPSSSFPSATWDNSDGFAALLCGMGIWAAAQGHSGC
jgi:hypothetical protein